MSLPISENKDRECYSHKSMNKLLSLICATMGLIHTRLCHVLEITANDSKYWSNQMFPSFGSELLCASKRFFHSILELISW